MLKRRYVPIRESSIKDIRNLDLSEVCGIGQWLTNYRQLNNTEIHDSRQLMSALGHGSREYESDLGLFVKETADHSI